MGAGGGGGSDGPSDGVVAMVVLPSEGKLESYTAPPPPAHAPRFEPPVAAALLRFGPPCTSHAPCHISSVDEQPCDDTIESEPRLRTMRSPP